MSGRPEDCPKLFLHDDRGSVLVIQPRANAKLLEEREGDWERRRREGWGDKTKLTKCDDGRRLSTGEGDGVRVGPVDGSQFLCSS